MVKKTFLLILLTFISKSFSQNNYVTIHVYRPKMMLGSAVTHRVNINGKEICELDNGGHLDYKPYDAGTPPKYYGQYLQRIGKQKWTKAKR